MSASVPEDVSKAELQYKEAIRTSPKRQQLWFSYGRFLIQQNRAKEGNQAFRTALDFDQNVGESWWYMGISTLYDLKQPIEGARQIASSTRVSSPYEVHSLREAMAMAEAFLILNDHAALKKMWSLLPNFTSDPLAMTAYLDLARIAERMGDLTLRDPILKWLTAVNRDIAFHLEPLRNGSVTSIDASLKLTPGNPPPVINTQAPSSHPTTLPAIPSGVGPRK